MISCPQGEVKHTGHVGLDGAYFGDISFLSSGAKVRNYLHKIINTVIHNNNNNNVFIPKLLHD